MKQKCAIRIGSWFLPFNQCYMDAVVLGNPLWALKNHLPLTFIEKLFCCCFCCCWSRNWAGHAQTSSGSPPIYDWIRKNPASILPFKFNSDPRGPLWARSADSCINMEFWIAISKNITYPLPHTYLANCPIYFFNFYSNTRICLCHSVGGSFSRYFKCGIYVYLWTSRISK